MMKDFEQLIAGLADEAGLVEPAPHPVRLSLMWIGAATVYVAVSLAVFGLRPDFARALSQPWFGAEIGALLLIFLAASFSAALLSFPDLHQKWLLAFAPLWMFVVFLIVIVFAWFADNPPAPLPEHSYECTACIVLLALLPAAWAFHTMRKFASTQPRWAGIVVVFAAFSVGSLWLRLHEVNDSIVHVVAWHYLPMLAFSVIGMWAGKWLLKW
jgi:hypothetical protein